MIGFLEKVVEKRRLEVARLRCERDVAFRSLAHSARRHRPGFGLSNALKTNLGPNIIAEIKRASPSKGIINDKINVIDVARDYEIGGAIAISVLTEPEYFRGSIDDLLQARSAVQIPILRKDFTVDEFQIYEAAAAGADAVLLIVAALDRNQLQEFQECAAGLGLDAVVEVHEENELETAISSGAKVIGVNNRNLKNLDVSLDTSRKLIGLKPEGILMISESGISSIGEIRELNSLGFDGFLVGETLMRETSAPETLRAWTTTKMS